jgi:signal transduction histidine kinase
MIAGQMIAEGCEQMCGRDGVCERKAGEPAMERIGRALHDLCQPLTTLQCRLEMAQLVGSNEAYREAIDLGLAECGRITDVVAAMREIVRAEARQAEARELGAGR